MSRKSSRYLKRYLDNAVPLTPKALELLIEKRHPVLGEFCRFRAPDGKKARTFKLVLKTRSEGKKLENELSFLCMKLWREIRYTLSPFTPIWWRLKPEFDSHSKHRRMISADKPKITYHKLMLRLAWKRTGNDRHEGMPSEVVNLS